jgi:SAM-dependent methyltransferase
VGERADLQATRIAYDLVAVDYAALLTDELAGKAFDRAMLATFAEQVHGLGSGPVADLGCGPGRVTTYLRSLGLEAFGIDLSPAMIDVARATYPDLRFDVGSIDALDIADTTLAGIVAWYSIIHTPPDRLPQVLGEFARVLCPGGALLLAFQVGNACVHLEQAYGHAISLDAYRMQPGLIADLLADAGFVVQVQAVRAPEPREKTAQAYILAQKPMGA